jgi:putative MATE family efflux protein
MENSFVKDMTIGSPVKLLLSFALPMLIGNLFQQFYNMVDSMVVGKYVSADALAAVGATGAVNFLFFSICFGMSTGIGIIISQYFGAKDDEYVSRSIANSIYVLMTAAVVMGILGFVLAEPLLKFLNTPENIIGDSILYMRITCLGLMAVAAYNGISSVLRALGDSKTPLIFLIIAALLNVVLDLVFVIVFHWGVAGVAIATIISQGVSALGSILFAFIRNPYFRMERSYLKPDRAIIKKCIRLGFPMALQSSMIAVSLVVLQSIVNSFGSVVVATFTVTSRIEQLVQQPYHSLATALSTYTGQNIGANQIERVKSGFRKCFLIMGVFTLCMLPLAQFCGHTIMSLFTNEVEVISIGVRALKITSWFYLYLGIIYITRGLLNGAGDTMYSLINGVMEMIGRIGFAKPLTMIPGVGVWGLWIATGLTWFITAIASLIRYWDGKWKRKSVVQASNCCG